LLAILYLLIAIGCPPSTPNDDAFGPGPDREISEDPPTEPEPAGEAAEGGEVVEEGGEGGTEDPVPPEEEPAPSETGG